MLTPIGSPQRPTEIAVTVWDLPLRLFHWGLVATFFVAYASIRVSGYFWLHRAAGIAMLGLLVFRILWGFMGPRPARFAGLLRGPRAIFAHLSQLAWRRHRPEPGHNALGGWAVLLMLILLLAEALSGVFASTFDYEGPLARLISDSASTAMASIHSADFNLLAAIVIVHLAAVAATSLLGRENLVASMIHGRKYLPAHRCVLETSIPGWRWPVAVSLAVILVWALLSIPDLVS
jgi:cytochrome b